MKVTFHTYVVNLAKDTARMNHMKDTLTSARLDWTRIDACNGHTEDTSKLYDVARARALHGSALLPGEVGCAVSHVRALRIFLTSSHPYALICEDDITVPSDMRKRVLHILTTHPDAFDYLSFDYMKPGYTFLKFWCNSITINWHKQHTLRTKLRFIFLHILKGTYIIPLSAFEGVRNTLRRFYPGPVYFARPLYLAGCYLVSRAGAEKLINAQTPIALPADKLPQYARTAPYHLRFRAYAPLVVNQEKDTFISRINPDHVISHLK